MINGVISGSNESSHIEGHEMKSLSFTNCSYYYFMSNMFQQCLKDFESDDKSRTENRIELNFIFNLVCSYQLKTALFLTLIQFKELDVTASCQFFSHLTYLTCPRFVPKQLCSFSGVSMLHGFQYYQFTNTVVYDNSITLLFPAFITISL